MHNARIVCNAWIVHCTVCAAHSQGSEVAQGRQLNGQAAIQLVVVQVTAGGIRGERGLRGGRGGDRKRDGRGK